MILIILIQAVSRVFFNLNYKPQIDLGLVPAVPEGSLIWEAPFIMGKFWLEFSSLWIFNS